MAEEVGRIPQELKDKTAKRIAQDIISTQARDIAAVQRVLPSPSSSSTEPPRQVTASPEEADFDDVLPAALVSDGNIISPEEAATNASRVDLLGYAYGLL